MKTYTKPYNVEDTVMSKETASPPKSDKNIKEFKPVTFSTIDLDRAITQFYEETKGAKAEAFVSADNLKIDLKRILAEMKKESK